MGFECVMFRMWFLVEWRTATAQSEDRNRSGLLFVEEEEVPIVWCSGEGSYVSGRTGQLEVGSGMGWVVVVGWRKRKRFPSVSSPGYGF